MERRAGTEPIVFWQSYLIGIDADDHMIKTLNFAYHPTIKKVIVYYPIKRDNFFPLFHWINLFALCSNSIFLQCAYKNYIALNQNLNINYSNNTFMWWHISKLTLDLEVWLIFVYHQLSFLMKQKGRESCREQITE